MGEGGGRSRISQIVSWDVDGLDGGNGSLLGGGNTLLHLTHVDGEGWLVTDGRWDTTQKSGHLGTGLGETENVVNEEQHILSFLVTEVLSDGKTGKGDTSTGSWWLVHLSEDEGHLGFTIELDDTGLLHFVVQIVTLTSTLTDTSEDGVTTVSLGNVVLERMTLARCPLDRKSILGWTHNQLLDEDSLSDTSTSEETNLTTTSVWGEQVDD
jgi:hypothetical protein